MNSLATAAKTDGASTPEALRVIAEPCSARRRARTRFRCSAASVRPEVRTAVATLLKDRTAAALPPLQAELRASDPEIRRIATETLGALGRGAPNALVPLIAASLEDCESTGRVAAVRALREVGAPAAPAVREALKHDEPADPTVRAHAQRAISGLR